MSAEGGARSVPSTGFITVTGVPVCTSTGPGLFTATQPTTASTASTGTTAYFGCGPGSRWTPAAGSRSYVPVCVSRVGLSSTCCDTAPGPPSLERLSVIRGPDGRIARIHYVLPRHKAANWVGPGRGRQSTRPGANGVVELTPFEFLDRLVDLVPPPRKHRHRYHGVFAPNHRLRKAVTALAIGNIGKQREAAAGGHGNDGRATGGCCDAHQKARSHDTSRIAWAKLLARVGRAIASSESGTSITVSRRKASGRRWPHATWPLSSRTTCDCFNDACNSFTL